MPCNGATAMALERAPSPCPVPLMPTHEALRRILLVAGLAMATLSLGCSKSRRAASPVAPTATQLSGLVLASDGFPLAGVTVSVRSGPETRTNERGQFVLTGFTGSEFHGDTVDLEVDASTGTDAHTFKLRMPIPLAPGTVGSLGGPFYVPIERAGTATQVHALAEQTILVADAPGASITVAAGAVDFNPGAESPQRTGRLNMVRIPKHRLPGGMPGGQVSDVVFSIQPSGVKFDPPARITLPNDDGFLPGEQVPIMQVNPDTGSWEQVGTGTVNAAGKVIVSDGPVAKWGSCTGCCYPPCVATIQGHVSVHLFRDGAPVEEPGKGAVVRFSTSSAVADDAGNYFMENVPVGNCRTSSGPFRLTGTATYQPADRNLPALQASKEVDIQPNQANTVDFELAGMAIAFLDDHNDRQRPSRGEVPAERPVDTVVADGEGEMGTSVALTFTFGGQESLDDLEVQVKVDADAAHLAYRGWLTEDSTLGDGLPGERKSISAWIPYRDLAAKRVRLRYQAPDRFGSIGLEEGPDGRYSRYAKISAQARRAINGRQEVVAATNEPAKIRIVRPQLFFIHGTTAGQDKWKTAEYLADTTFSWGHWCSIEGVDPTPFLDRYRHIVGATPYERFTAEYHSISTSRVEAIVPGVLDQLEALREYLVAHDRVAATRFDVSAHSYGGIVARHLIATLDADPGVARRVRRLATFGTPHLGASSGDRFMNVCDDAVPGAGAARQEILADLDGRIVRWCNGASVLALHRVAIALTERSRDFGTSVYTDTSIAHRLTPERIAIGFVPWVKYMFVYGETGAGLFDAAYTTADLSSGNREKEGDLLISSESARAGLIPRDQVVVLAPGANHSQTVGPRFLQHATQFFAASEPPHVVPSPIPEMLGPALLGFSHLEIDLDGPPPEVTIYGRNFRPSAPTQVELEVLEVLAPNPVIVRQRITVPRTHVTSTTIRFDAANPLPRKATSGWVRVIVDLDEPTNAMHVAFRGTLPGYIAPILSLPLLSKAGSAGPVEVLVEHYATTLLDPEFDLDGEPVRVVEVLGRQSLSNGRTRTRVRLELPSAGGVRNLRLREGRRAFSETLAITRDSTIDGLAPAATCIGMPVTVSGTGFGEDPSRVQVTVGGVAQFVRTVRPTRLVFVVADGTTTGPLQVSVGGRVAIGMATLEVAADQDRDGMPDAFETRFGLAILDPADAAQDRDGDGLSNLQEYRRQTDPTRADTDGGGVADGEEIRLGLDPRDPADDAGDPDLDGLSTPEELRLGTNPVVADTDGDGLKDGEEVRAVFGYATNPLLSDTDGDLIDDGREVLVYHTDPLRADTDGDGLSDGEEILGLLGPITDPVRADTDGDGLDDGAEIRLHRTNPILADTDGDGLDDGTEINVHGTNPLSGDTDGDSLSDLTEVQLGTNPTLPTPLTTLSGFVQRPDLTPAVGATVEIVGFSLPQYRVTTLAGGDFTLRAWPASLSPVQVRASLRESGLGLMRGQSPAVPTIANGTTPMGTVLLIADAEPLLFPGPAHVFGGFIDDIVAGDLDQDGVPDVAAGSEYGLLLFPGRGNGSFGTLRVIAPGAQPSDLAIADIDRDGRPDLLFVSGAAGVGYCRSLGNGQFAQATLIPSSIIPQSLAVADLTGDGLPDIVLLASYSLQVLRATSAGQFVAVTPVPLTAPGHHLAVGQLESDALPEVVVAHAEHARLTVFRNVGSGTLVPARDLPTGTQPFRVSIVDLNGDARQDIACLDLNGTSDSHVVLFENLGLAGFAAPRFLYPGVATLGDLVVRDLNGDGLPDLAMPQLIEDQVFVYHNTGNFAFERRAAFHGGSLPRRLLAVDLDSDAQVDLVSVCVGSIPGLVVHRGLPGGSFAHLEATESGVVSFQQTAAGDLDGDGLADTIEIDFFTDDLLLRRGTGGGRFGPTQPLRTGLHCRRVVIADVDGGGRDVVVAHTDGIAVLRNRGSGQFDPPRIVRGGYYHEDLILADMDGDGRVDVLTLDSSRLYLWRNLGGANFAAAVVTNLPRRYERVVAGRFDGDTMLDVALSSSAAGETRVFRGAANGTFAQLAVVPYGGEVAAADTDGDGMDDLVVASLLPMEVRVLRNPGNGLFAGSIQLSSDLPLIIQHLAVADLDGDGRRDIVAASYYGVETWKNTGGGTFTSNRRFSTRGLAQSIQVLDVDGDGRRDLLLGVGGGTTGRGGINTLLAR